SISNFACVPPLPASLFPYTTLFRSVVNGHRASGGRRADGRRGGRGEMRARSDVLGTAILGLLHESPMHGYELRKRLNEVLGSFRALSYGSLYPALRALADAGLIAGAETDSAPPHALSGKRARIVYELTAAGKERLQSALAEAGPAAWEDGSFDVRFALFAHTDAE